MICPSCNSQNFDGARFCSTCAADLNATLHLSQSASAHGGAGAAVAMARDPEDEATQANPSVDSGQAATVVSSGPENRAQAPSGTGDPLIGRTISDRYRIDGKLGAGGMGAVYRAHRLMIGDEVAVKVLHPHLVSEPEASERFRREAQAAVRVKHPNAVSVYDFGVASDGVVYLVMELVEGQSLRQLLKQQGPLTPSAAGQVINQVCAALDEAHRQEIVHRDLKPDNIVVKPMLNGLRVKVLDFGIAKLRDLVAGDLTQTGSVMGTPHYMSPEQCLGEDLDCRSDIYSLGVVLYEMLVGVVPFSSPSSNAVVVAHVNQTPPTLRGINPDISVAAEGVVMRALAKKREERPQTARALAAEFMATVDAGLPNTGERTPARTEPVVLHPTLHVSRAPGSGQYQPYPVAGPTPTPGTSKYLIPAILVGALLLALGVIAGFLIDASRRESAKSPSVTPTSAPSGNATDNRAAAQAATPESVPSPAPKAEQAAAPENRAPGLPDYFQRGYRGTIGKGLGLRVALTKSGRSLTGTASTSGSNDTLKGEIQSDGSFKLYGYENGGPLTGIYTGTMRTDGTVSGVWTSTSNGKRASFYLRQE